MSLPGSSRSASPTSRLQRRPILAMVADGRLHLKVGGSERPDDECAAVVAAAGRAAGAGVDLVQIRERTLEAVLLVDLAARVRSAIGETGARVLINDRVDVAIAAGTDGVHLPASAPACDRVRAIVPDGFLIGRSVHSVAEAVAVEAAGGCDYVVFGTVYESRSKPAGHPIAGVEALANVCRSVRLPVLAIGGISLERIPEIADAGAAGVAAIGLFGSAGQAELADTVAKIRYAFVRSSAGLS